MVHEPVIFNPFSPIQNSGSSGILHIACGDHGAEIARLRFHSGDFGNEWRLTFSGASYCRNYCASYLVLPAHFADKYLARAGSVGCVGLIKN